MRGTLRIFRTQKFSVESLEEFIRISLKSYGEMHFLLTDGIMINFREVLSPEIMPMVLVQRILTSYQLQKILMDSDQNPYYISVTSAVIEAWPSSVVESIYDILKIKAQYHGAIVYLNIVGHGGVFEKYLGNRILSRNSVEERGGLYSWEEQFQQ